MSAKPTVIEANSPADLGVAELANLFRRGALSPVEAAEAALQRIDSFDTSVNAFVYRDRATTLAMARASCERFRSGCPLGLLDGIPTSIKDLAPVAGWPVRRGSLALDPTIPAPEDSPPVARLREAGAVFVGKTATPESGSRIVTRSAVHGVTCNPYVLDRTPGGSSGGAAAALALGMGTLALGTDGAGSIRIPAAFCNLVGLKPGFGRVPSFPPSFFMPHSVTGPMARRVADVAAMLEVMARPEPRDPYAWPLPFDPAARAAEGPVGLRVAVSPTLGGLGQPDRETEAAIWTVAEVLGDSGALVEEADPEWPADPYETFMVFWEATYAGFLDSYAPEQAERMDPLLREIAARGRSIDILSYHRALAGRLAIAAAAQAFFNRYHAVLTPVMPGPAFDLQAEAPPGEAPDDWRWCPFTYLFNMTGQPAISVPADFTSDGLPIGVQLAGGAGQEETLLALATAVETRRNLTHRLPPCLGA
ncbi:amidase family protein [Algihabitans albus]|uniref:amidase family protein n=1 Tax=Algihabitans albus TaxID=2164067 RepID=UPI0013C2F2D4|nr:amidase family protein [Algihabitans albus]